MQMVQRLPIELEADCADCALAALVLVCAEVSAVHQILITACVRTLSRNYRAGVESNGVASLSGVLAARSLQHDRGCLVIAKSPHMRRCHERKCLFFSPLTE